MSDPSLSTESGTPAPDQQLTERLLARIKDAHRTAKGAAPAGLGKGRRRRSSDSDTRALRRVFLDLGESYRSYRRRTGEPIAPEVRDAALRFRRELNLLSLVSVAATLERLDHDMIG